MIRKVAIILSLGAFVIAALWVASMTTTVYLDAAPHHLWLGLRAHDGGCILFFAHYPYTDLDRFAGALPSMRRLIQDRSSVYRDGYSVYLNQGYCVHLNYRPFSPYAPVRPSKPYIYSVIHSDLVPLYVWPFRLWMPFALLLVFPCIYPVYILVWRNTRRWRRKRGLCESCGYNLTGNVTGICSECGHPIFPEPITAEQETD